MKATNYTTSINTAATAVSSVTTIWQDRCDQACDVIYSAAPCGLEMDKWGHWMLSICGLARAAMKRTSRAITAQLRRFRTIIAHISPYVAGLSP